MSPAETIIARLDQLSYPTGDYKSEAYKDLLAVYNAEKNNAVNDFRLELEGTYAHSLPAPALDAVWQLAWEQGHSTGYYDVESSYQDIVHVANVTSENIGR